MFCQATGFGGTTRRKTIEQKLVEQAKKPEAGPGADATDSLSVYLYTTAAAAAALRVAAVQGLTLVPS